MLILLISIILALIIVIFAIQNAIVVPIDFLFWTVDLPLVVVIFCSVFAGALIMFCLALWRGLKNKIGKKEINFKVDPVVNKNLTDNKLKETSSSAVEKTNDEVNKEQNDMENKQVNSK